MIDRRVSAVFFAAMCAFSFRAQPVDAAQPASLQVVAREFRYTLSRPSVPAGQVYVELANLGQDAHDLTMRRKEGGPAISFPVTQAGQHTLKLLTLKAGHYLLWCGVANHAAIGMTATLIVKAPSRKKN